MAICKGCGAQFVPRNGKQKYCTEFCRDHNGRGFKFTRQEQREKILKDTETVISLFDSDYSAKEIADMLGRNVGFVNEKWREAGMQPRPTPLQKEIKKLREQGKTCLEISRETGKTCGAVRAVVNRIGMPFTEDEKKRSRHNQFTKETEQEKKQYVEAFLPEGFSYVDGYTWCDCFVMLKCDACGETFERSMVSIRQKANPVCPNCETIRKEKALAAEKEQRERRAKELEYARKIKKLLEEKERELKKITKTCRICGKKFKSSRKDAVCCSEECRKKYCNRYSAARKDKRITKDKRIDKGITARALYNRDNGVCWICGGECDLNDHITKNGVIICGNKYPSVDHVIPICEGGEDSWENVKLAHRYCNSARYWGNHAK